MFSRKQIINPYYQDDPLLGLNDENPPDTHRMSDLDQIMMEESSSDKDLKEK